MAWIRYILSKVEKCDCLLTTAPRICLLVLFMFVMGIILFLAGGLSFVAQYSYCDAFYFGKEEPNALILPDLRNLSESERNSFEEGSYKLSSEHYLKLTQDYLGVISLCVLKRYHTRVSACFEIGTDLEDTVVCSPNMRPDCLPGSIVDHYLGASLWYQNDSTVVYTIVDIDSSAIYGKEVTNTTTTLSAVWYYVLQYCQVTVNLTIAMIFFGILNICCLVPCLGCGVWCFWTRLESCRYKCCHALIVTCKRLMKQKQDDELALSNLEETGAYHHERSFEFLEEGGDKEETSFGPSSLVHQDGSSSAFLDVSSSEEEDLQVELLPAGSLSSRESVRTAVSERGHRRHGQKYCFVPANRPTVGYFTDSTSVSGVATDVSTNDASDEDSNEDVQGQLSSASSVTMMVQEEATKVNTPPLFARLHHTTVYDHRPGVTNEPRRPPDGL